MMLCCCVSQPPTEPNAPGKLHLVSGSVSAIRVPAGVDQLAIDQNSLNALCQSPLLSVDMNSIM